MDLPTVLSAQRETLTIRVQVAQVEGELGKALASLERAVGCAFNDHPPAPGTPEVAAPPTTGPFREADSPAVPERGGEIAPDRR